MSDVSDALFNLEAFTVEYKALTRKIDGDGIIENNTIAPVNVEARVIPTNPKELDVSEISSTTKEFFSFYIFDSFSFTVNDIFTFKGEDYKIVRGWDRNDNGGYTKIIAARQATEIYADA